MPDILKKNTQLALISGALTTYALLTLEPGGKATLEIDLEKFRLARRLATCHTWEGSTLNEVEAGIHNLAKEIYEFYNV